MVNIEKLRANSKLNAALIGILVLYAIVVLFGVFFGIEGYSVRPGHLLTAARFLGILLSMAVFLILYRNRSHQWAGIGLGLFAIAGLFVPTGLTAHWFFSSAAMMALLLSPLKEWQKGLFAVPAGLIVLFLTLLVLVAQFASKPEVSNSVSPDQKHEIEVKGDGHVLGGPTRASLYRIYPRFGVRRIERSVAEERNWPPKVKIKWIDSKTVVIHGKRFDL
jgi:hypothetical protein